MTAGKDRNTSDPTTPEIDSDAPSSTKRIEDFLVTETSSKVSFKDLAKQEVKTHKSRSGSLRWVLVLVVLLLLAGLAGWYLYPFSATDRSRAQVAEIQVEKRMEMPSRPPLPQEPEAEKTVNEELAALPSDHSGDVLTGLSQDSSDIIPPDTGPGVAEAEEVSGVAPMTPAEVEPPGEETSVAVVADEALYRVLVGPIVSTEEVARATALLVDKGFRPQSQPESGTVDMIRLLEGIYPLAQAQERLEQLQSEFPSAFLLPDGDRWALYIGSFSDRDRARRQQRALAERQIEVAQVDSQLTMAGTLLIVAHADEKTAEGVAAEIRASGLRARVEIER